MKVKYMLGDISDVSAGQGAPQKESDFCNVGKPFIRAGSLAKLVEGYSEHSVCELINDDTAKIYGLRLYPKNTIIFAKSGKSTTKGYVHVLSQECYIVNHLACINMYNDNSSYMKYYFRYYKPNQLIKDDAYPSISLTDIRNMIVNIHNIQTQKKIVAVLDKVTLLISMRKEQLDKLDILVKSKFIEMFGDPVLNPKGWEKKKLGEVCYLNKNSLNNHTDPNYSFTYIDLSLVKEGNIQFPKNKITFQSSPSRARRIIKKNDVIIATVRPNLKGFACINFDVDNMIVSTGFAVLTPITNIHAHYLHHLFYTDLLTEQINKVVKGANYPAINGDDIKNFIIPIPPLDIQNQFAEFVEQVEKNKENIKSSLNQLETLYNALMQEYFG